MLFTFTFLIKILDQMFTKLGILSILKMTFLIKIKVFWRLKAIEINVVAKTIANDSLHRSRLTLKLDIS